MRTFEDFWGSALLRLGYFFRSETCQVRSALMHTLTCKIWFFLWGCDVALWWSSRTLGLSLLINKIASTLSRRMVRLPRWQTALRRDFAQHSACALSQSALTFRIQKRGATSVHPICCKNSHRVLSGLSFWRVYLWIGLRFSRIGVLVSKQLLEDDVDDLVSTKFCDWM